MDSVCKVKIFACPIGPEEIFGVAKIKANLRGCSEGVEGICRDFIISGTQPFFGDETYFYGSRESISGNYTQAQRATPRVANLLRGFPDKNTYLRISASSLGLSPQQTKLVNRSFDCALSLLSPDIFNERVFPKEGVRQSIRESLFEFPLEVTEWARDAGKILIYSDSKNLNSFSESPLYIE